MTVREVVRLRPGPGASAWLIRLVRELQDEDPLRAVTVVVPSGYSGLQLRRRLATGGYAGVRFSGLSTVAEALAGGALAAQGKLPLGAVTRDALIRACLREDGGPLADSAEEPGLAELIASLAAELRRQDDLRADAGRIFEVGTVTSRSALRVVAAYEQRRRDAGRYDAVDLLDAAASVLEGGGGGALLRDLGAVIVHLPRRLDPPEMRLLGGLAARTTVVVALADLEGETADPARRDATDPAPERAAEAGGAGLARVVLVSDPVEEVRSAVRDVLAALEGADAVPLHRTAIVYRDEETYLGPLRDTLRAVGTTPVLLGGRPLIDSVAARGLLGLIRLRDQDFARPAVLAWLSGLPDRGGVLRNQARWDQLSRAAGVVRGADQWRDRLGRLIEERTLRLETVEIDPDDPIAEARRAAIEREIEDARRIAEHVAAIDELTRAPEQASWRGYVDWALRLRDEFLTPDAAWTAEEVEAFQMVEEVARGLVAAAEVEPAVSVAVFLRTLEDGLRSRRRPQGRMGGGVVIGPHRLLLGMDFDRVHILGAVESSFPASLPVDPLLPGDPLGRREEHEAEQRRDWMVALAAAAREVVVSAPLVDLDGRAVFPSPWLLELLADDGTPPPATAVRGGALTHPQLRRAGAGGGSATAVPLHVAERREREAAAAQRGRWDLLSTPLARRDDLPLGRALRALQARRSSRFTEFDGNAGAVTALPVVARGLGDAPQSASRIQTWATCPFHFLLGRVLVVAATEAAGDDRWWQMDAAERGRLIHRILERFFAEVASSGDPAPGVAYGAAHVRRMEAIAAEEFETWATRGATGHPLVWENERAAILADLRTLLRRDAEERAEGGWRPAHLEQPFGFDADPRSWPAVTVRLHGGRAITLRGYIDRVDRGPLGVRVIDYKTGRAKDVAATALTRLDGGRSLQLPVYTLAVREHDRAEGRPVPHASALYWYCTSRGDFRRHAVEVGGDVDQVLSGVLADVDAGIRAGCFPQEPGEYDDHFRSWEHCAYCEYDSLCPAGRDTLAAAKASDPALEPYRALQPEIEETSR
jgi:ATP-dependent helicase/nuclease subunit B